MSLRHLRLLLGAALLCAPLSFAQSAAPASSPASSVCSGTMTIVRISEIKPGKMDDFMAAVAAHQAWYRNNGVATNRIYAARILEQDPTTKQWHVSDTQVMTFHVNPPRPDNNLPRNNDAWKAYVQKYRDSSDLKTEFVTCSMTPVS
ncbi:MAG TPA: hypothetical protein VGU25_14915 [Acidobacteriaceae bacterium]|nr:hypothetical protein [Acidobacteriaceae bacterium]